ncbi:hypothetical protein C8R43DRAFT_1109909 [Mycena crocata]|nr:hypothetical protein C8R43DRAFT_1109909 [Mycena crocata]
MHHCLCVPEIVGMVCEELSGKSQALAVLARSCTAFLEPALDVLWRDQKTLWNFLRCLPQDLFTVEDEGTGYRRLQAMRLLRPIVATDWDRALVYARRIRTLECEKPPVRISYPDVLMATSMSFPGDCLFPNLDRLIWRKPEGEFPYARFFLSPRLTTITICCRPSTAQMSLFSIPPQKSPAWKVLKLLTPDLAPRMSSSVCMLLDPVPHVESLQIAIPDVAILQAIGRLRNLNKEVVFSELPSHLVSSPLPGTHLFVNGRQLEITDVAAPITAFFRLCAHSRLQKVKVELELPTPPSSVMNDLFTSLAASQESLTQIRMKASQDVRIPEGRYEQYLLDYHTLRPLFCFGRLTDVKELIMSFDASSTSLASLDDGVEYSSVSAPLGVTRFQSLTSITTPREGIDIETPIGDLEAVGDWRRRRSRCICGGGAYPTDHDACRLQSGKREEGRGKAQAQAQRSSA